MIITKRGKNTWVVGVDTSKISIPGMSDLSGAQSLEMNRTIQSAHTKDKDGITRLSVYFDASGTITTTVVYAGEKPNVGDVLVDNSDPENKKVFQITSVGQSYNNGGTASTCNISAEWFEGWEDDAEVAAEIQGI